MNIHSRRMPSMCINLSNYLALPKLTQPYLDSVLLFPFFPFFFIKFFPVSKSPLWHAFYIFFFSPKENIDCPIFQILINIFKKKKLQLFRINPIHHVFQFVVFLNFEFRFSLFLNSELLVSLELRYHNF